MGQKTMKDESCSDETRVARRRLLKLAGITGAAGLGAIFLPSSWTKPVVHSIVTPAHAQMTVRPDA
jgi:hypothetical protein